MHLFRIDETDFTSTLKSSLDGYVRGCTDDNFGRAYTPHSTKQAIRSLETKSQCFDLVKRITASSLLLLEIKITDDLLKFVSYSKRQHDINNVLRNTGIPIEYCYNLKDDYEVINDDVYTLEYSNTSPPISVCNDKGHLTNKELHISLKGLVDSMIEKSSDDDAQGARYPHT